MVGTALNLPNNLVGVLASSALNSQDQVCSLIQPAFDPLQWGRPCTLRTMDVSLNTQTKKTRAIIGFWEVGSFWWNFNQGKLRWAQSKARLCGKGPTSQHQNSLTHKGSTGSCFHGNYKGKLGVECCIQTSLMSSFVLVLGTGTALLCQTDLDIPDQSGVFRLAEVISDKNCRQSVFSGSKVYHWAIKYLSLPTAPPPMLLGHFPAVAYLWEKYHFLFPS